MAGVCQIRKFQTILKIDFRNFGLKTFVAAQQNCNVSELNNLISETVSFVVSIFIEYFYLQIWVVSIVMLAGGSCTVHFLCIFTFTQNLAGSWIQCGKIHSVRWCVAPGITTKYFLLLYQIHLSVCLSIK